MSTLKIVAGAVAVTGAVVVGYKALKRYQQKKAEKQIIDAFQNLADEMEKIFGKDSVETNFTWTRS